MNKKEVQTEFEALCFMHEKNDKMSAILKRMSGMTHPWQNNHVNMGGLR